MDYKYLNHNHSRGDSNKNLLTTMYSEGGNNSHAFGNCNYPATINPLYQNSDPRLNYCYGTTPSVSGSISTNNQLAVPMYDLSIPNSKSNIDIKTDDELWIETWLSKTGKIKINLNSTVEVESTENSNIKNVKPMTVIHINAAKNSLKNCLLVLNKLQKMQELLKTNAATMSSTDWKKKTMEIGTIKDEFSKLISQFENPDTMTLLRKAVEKRRKKRDTQKRRRRQHAANMVQMHEERKKAHKDIDQWLENMKEEVERTKMEENMKKDADCVLAEVTKKKSDARKSLALISSLVKLRHVREGAALQRGNNVSVEDRVAFIKITEHLTKIWNDALNVYSKEEQGLQVMLEQNAVEDTNAARAAKERRITQEWDMALFGPKCIPSPAFWGLTSAEKDLETFIAIRKSWDTFLTRADNENGSKIPIGWILPNLHASERWTKYLNPV